MRRAHVEVQVKLFSSWNIYMTKGNFVLVKFPTLEIRVLVVSRTYEMLNHFLGILLFKRPNRKVLPKGLHVNPTHSGKP